MATVVWSERVLSHCRPWQSVEPRSSYLLRFIDHAWTPFANHSAPLGHEHLARRSHKTSRRVPLEIEQAFSMDKTEAAPTAKADRTEEWQNWAWLRVSSSERDLCKLPRHFAGGRGACSVAVSSSFGVAAFSAHALCTEQHTTH